VVGVAAILWLRVPQEEPEGLALHPVIDPAIASEPPMRVIKQLVDTGDLSSATRQLSSAYHFSGRHGLAALQQFSLDVL
jgi:hypothetical protein